METGGSDAKQSEGIEGSMANYVDGDEDHTSGEGTGDINRHAKHTVNSHARSHAAEQISFPGMSSLDALMAAVFFFSVN